MPELGGLRRGLVRGRGEARVDRVEIRVGIRCWSRGGEGVVLVVYRSHQG
jgi:hypothetical protein